MLGRPYPYVATLAMIALITGVKLSIAAIGSQVPFLLYFVAVLFAAGVGGRRAGILATVVSALVVNFLFLGSSGRFELHFVPLFQTAVFCVEGFSIVAIVDLMRASRRRAHAVNARVTGLQKLTSALSVARTPEEVTKAVVERGIDLLDATSGEMVRTGDGIREDSSALTARPASGALAPVIATALRTGQVQLTASCVAVPLRNGDRSLGAVAFAFEAERPAGEGSRGILETIAQQAAQALDRAQSFEREVWLRSKLEMLAGTASDLSRAATSAEVANVVVERGVDAMAADTCTLYLLDDAGTTLQLAASRGVAGAVLEKIRTVTETSSPLLWHVLTSGERQWVETFEDYVRKFPDIATSTADGPRAKAFWTVPLVVEGRTIGLLSMGYHAERRFHEEKRRLVETFAQQCAQALLRALRVDGEVAARKAAEDAHAKLARDEERRMLVAETTAALATSLEYKATLSKLAELLVPRLADWCSIEMIDETTRVSAPLAVTHSDPQKIADAWEMRRRFPPDPSSVRGVPHVLRTGKSEIYEHITDEMLMASAVNEEHARLALALQLRSAIIVPLTARGVTLGALTIVYAESGRRYTAMDLELVEEIARRAAIGVDNARLYGAEQRAREAADEANRLKDEFLATVSHELRTPLNAILGWSRMITTGVVDETRRARAHETIERNAIAMTQLIEDLLDISRIISGKMRLEIESLDLAKVVEAAIDSIRPAALAKEIVIRAVLEPSPGPVVGDPNRMQQVFWNLLSNSVKFTPRGGRVEVVLRRSGSHAELRVSDSGSGIAPEFVPYVFDRFRQADGKITRAHGGLGLGLAITKQLVELHGGTVDASSDGAGRGATFVVKLPVSAMRPIVDAKPATADGDLAHAHDGLRGLRLLAVDDDEDSRRIVQAVLEKAGAVVTLAASVDEALAAFDREIPDVVLSDIGMPGKDGMELMRLIRERSPERGGRVPAAALTAYARAGDRARVLGAGFLMHLPKPVDPDELVAVVSNLARFRAR